jgi:hypothetical protein
VVRAIVEGEPAEAIVAAMAGLNGPTGDLTTHRHWGPIDETVRRWHEWRRRYATRARPTASHQVDKALGVILPYVRQLEGLPAGADVARVGSVDLVDDELRGVMATWPARVEDRSGLVAIHDEIRASMATLNRARMLLDLGLLRLVD